MLTFKKRFLSFNVSQKVTLSDLMHMRDELFAVQCHDYDAVVTKSTKNSQYSL